MNLIGQFIPGHSFLHRMDPRTKILFVFILVIATFSTRNWIVFAWIFLFIFMGLWISGVSLLYAFKTLKQIWVIVFLTAFLHMWMTQGGTVVFHFSFIVIYEEGLNRACFVAIRFVILVLSASLLTFTTSTLDLIDGLEKLFQPLSRFGFPAHEFALMMSITLRFIPLLWEELNKVKSAQLARGAKFDQGWIGKRMKNMIPLFVPLFLSIFRRSEELAQAMESRCYRGSQDRTKFRQLAFTRVDGWALLIMLILILGYFALQKVGVG